MDTIEEIKSQLKILIDLVEAEIALLRQISQEGANKGVDFSDASDFAQRLEKKAIEIRQHILTMNDLTLREQAQNWGRYFGNIYRIVDARYTGSQYEPLREKTEKAIYEGAMSLYKNSLEGSD